jgi:hypothetical protein
MTNPATPTPAPPGPPASGGGMPKWLIIVLAVGLVVVLGCCGGITTCWWIGRGVARQARDAIVAETQRQAQAGGGVSVGGVSVGGAMPANFPADVPVMEGYTSAGVSVANAAQGTGMVMLSGKGTRADVVAYYEKQMKDRGWTETNNVAMGASSTMIFSKDSRQATIQAVETNGSVTLTIQYGSR